jgi:hypothetical protein
MNDFCASVGASGATNNCDNTANSGTHVGLHRIYQTALRDMHHDRGMVGIENRGAKMHDILAKWSAYKKGCSGPQREYW